MEDFKHIFFDFDGTLFNTSEGVFKSFDVVADFYGIKLEDKSVYNTMIGPPLRDSFVRVFNLREDQIDEAIEVYRTYYTPHGLWECCLYDGVVELIKKLRAAGKKIYVATSKPELYAKQLLERNGILDLFDFVGGGDMAETRSTKIEIINYVISSNNLEDCKNECVMIGDTHYDINGANAADLKSIGILWGFGTRETLSNAGATYICNSTEEVEKLLLS